MTRVLVVGETEVIEEVLHKGNDSLRITSRSAAGSVFVDALRAQGHEVTWIDSEHAAEDFPFTGEDLSPFDVVVLSDVGANSLLMSRDVHHGRTRPNRLDLIRDWVAAGGGLVMCGGWMSFAGMNGAAHYHRTGVEEALPVRILPYDDRVETPQGTVFTPVLPDHAVLDGIAGPWPPVLGYNLVQPDDDAVVVATSPSGDAVLVVGAHGAGRSVAWMTDVAPHWAGEEFQAWPSYARLFGNLVRWASGLGE